MELIAYRVYDNVGKQIKKGSNKRTWMDETNEKFAYRCLPLVHANEFGWDIKLDYDLKVTWNGGNRIEDIIIQTEKNVWCNAASHFGSGVLTFTIDYLFKTSPDISLLVTGEFNNYKDGIIPLTGLVETDVLDFTFTMNWKFTRPTTVIFNKNETFCRIIPIKKNLINNIDTSIKNLSENEELKKSFSKYSESRSKFNEELKIPNSEASKEKWQKKYFKLVENVGLNLKDFQ